MKLYSTCNSDLIAVRRIDMDGLNLMVEGAIMGATLIRAVLKPAGVRSALGQMTLRTMPHAFLILFRGSR